nr:ATP-binding protein [Candidatus Gracilibacteria bacterium]
DIIPYLDEPEILVLLGARQVGKTHILYLLQDILHKKEKKTYYIDLEDRRMLTILDQGVEAFLAHLDEEGLDYQSLTVFIDEIQYFKNPSSFLKLLIDHYGLKLIVSGSSSFEIKSKFQDSLVGRTLIFTIYPLSFSEFLNFKGEILPSTTLLSAKKISELTKLYEEYIISGGYPRIVLTKEKAKKERFLQQIIDTYLRVDIRDIGQIRDLDKFNRLLRILATQSGQLLNIQEIANTCQLSKQTVEKYLFILENTFVIRILHPFSTNLRSELFKQPKIFFYDTGLMHLLAYLSLPNTVMGNSFENSVLLELLKNHYDLNFWRTKEKKEVDFIVRKANQKLAIEVKKHFPLGLGNLNVFQKKYPDYQPVIIGLEGVKRDFCHYPWEISLKNAEIFKPKTNH